MSPILPLELHAGEAKPWNLLLVTADDMNGDSSGMTHMQKTGDPLLASFQKAVGI